MDYYGEHIDNKFGGCDVPFDGKVSEVIPLEEQLAFASKAITPVVEAIKGIMPVVKELANFIGKLYVSIMQEYPNKRVVHLALHGKKERTRKKNINRIYKWLNREADNQWQKVK